MCALYIIITATQHVSTRASEVVRSYLIILCYIIYFILVVYNYCNLYSIKYKIHSVRKNHMTSCLVI